MKSPSFDFGEPEPDVKPASTSTSVLCECPEPKPSVTFVNGVAWPVCHVCLKPRIKWPQMR